MGVPAAFLLLTMPKGRKELVWCSQVALGMGQIQKLVSSENQQARGGPVWEEGKAGDDYQLRGSGGRHIHRF